MDKEGCEFTEAIRALTPSGPEENEIKHWVKPPDLNKPIDPPGRPILPQNFTLQCYNEATRKYDLFVNTEVQEFAFGHIAW